MCALRASAAKKGVARWWSMQQKNLHADLRLVGNRLVFPRQLADAVARAYMASILVVSFNLLSSTSMLKKSGKIGLRQTRHSKFKPRTMGRYR